MKEYWEKDFYQIEWHGKEKYIHIMGYFYDNGNDNKWGTSRLLEFCGYLIPLIDFIQMTNEERIEEEGEYNGYITEMTPDEAIKTMNTYYMGKPPIEMPLDEINMDTPCGYYVDWKGEE